MADLTVRMPRPRIGLLTTGHYYYWDQFPGLRERGARMSAALRERLQQIGDVICPEMVDTAEKARAAGDFFREQDPDILLVFPLGYTTGMCVLPAVAGAAVPIRLLNAHEDSSYDYATADTATYLHHEGPCCIPEYAAGLVSIGKDFRVRSGPFGSERLWRELQADCAGAAAARAFRQTNFALIGETYTHMVDMPIDEHRVLAATGRMLVRPEVEEIQAAYERVTDEQLDAMYDELRRLYEVDGTVTNAHLRFSAQTSIAYEEVIRKHDIGAFGYYWWGQKELMTQLRAQSNVAVSRLASMGRPGVTEGDVKTAMALKILDLLGAGGMFVEFFAIDYDEEFILLGHDGPTNINMAGGPPRLQHLEVQHGKSGHGLGIDFDVRLGPITLLNVSQFDAGDTFKLIYTVGETIPGDILKIGNPNCRVRIPRPIPEFMDAWCRQGPAHHIGLGIGDLSAELEAFGESMGFPVVRV
jgi:L-arabinose isomerase